MVSKPALLLLPALIASATTAPRFEELSARARGAEQAGDYRTAVSVLEGAAALRPDDRETAAELAHGYEELGRIEKAASFLRRAVERWPRDYQLRVSLAQDYVKLGRLAWARREFAAARALDAKAREAYIREGYADAKAGDYADAEKTFRAFLDKSPDDPAANHHMGVYLALRGRWPDAERYLRKAIALLEADPKASPEDVTHSTVWLAKILEKEKRPDEAEAVYLNGWRRFKDLNDRGYRVVLGTGLAGLYVREGRPKDAEAALLAEIAQCPPSQSCYTNVENAGALSALAALYADQGRLAQAREHADRVWGIYEHADHVNPLDFNQHALALIDTTRTYEVLGDSKRAAQVYRFLLGFKDELAASGLLQAVQRSLKSLER